MINDAFIMMMIIIIMQKAIQCVDSDRASLLGGLALLQLFKLGFSGLPVV